MKFEIGNKLTHKIYGTGTIINISNREFAYGAPDQPIITIDFGHTIGTNSSGFGRVPYTTADFIPQTINSDNFEF